MKNLNLPLLQRPEIQRQLKKLGTDWKASKSNLIYGAQRNLIPQTAGRRGRGVKTEYAPETAAELHTNRELFKQTGLTLDQIRIVRELGLKVYDAVENITLENFDDFNRMINRLSDAFEGKEFFVVPVMYWITTRQSALIKLYGEKIERESKQVWQNPELLVDFMTNLCRGAMRTWRRNKNGKIIRPDQPAAPRIEEALFATAGAESSERSLAAKPRN